jgi:hypothetical protein
MPILLNSAGKRILTPAGKLRMGSSGDPCCCPPAHCSYCAAGQTPGTLTVTFVGITACAGFTFLDSPDQTITLRQDAATPCRWFNDTVTCVLRYNSTGETSNCHRVEYRADTGVLLWTGSGDLYWQIFHAHTTSCPNTERTLSNHQATCSFDAGHGGYWSTLNGTVVMTPGGGWG